MLYINPWMTELPDKYIDPLTDYGFKRLFGTEPNKEFLISLLNELLPERHQIKNLQFINTERLGIGPLDRRAIYDVHCQSTTGEQFIVEVQRVQQRFFKDRSVFYASYPLQMQGERSEWNFRLDPVYTVGILDFLLEGHEEHPDVINVVELKNQRGKVFFDKLKFIYVELPKFTKSLDELTTPLDRWLYLLRHMPDLQQIPELFGEGVFKRILDQAKLANMSRAELLAYHETIKIRRDWKNVLDYALEKGIEQGIEKGIEQGIEKGIEQGIEKGVEKGIERGVQQERLRAARRMLKQGMDRQTIKGITELNDDDLARLDE